MDGMRISRGVAPHEEQPRGAPPPSPAPAARWWLQRPCNPLDAHRPDPPPAAAAAGDGGRCAACAARAARRAGRRRRRAAPLRQAAGGHVLPCRSRMWTRPQQRCRSTAATLGVTGGAAVWTCCTLCAPRLQQHQGSPAAPGTRHQAPATATAPSPPTPPHRRARRSSCYTTCSASPRCRTRTSRACRASSQTTPSLRRPRCAARELAAGAV
jgi:hypothetical protein